MRATQNSKKKARILIADREAVFRLGLRKLLSIEDDLRVVAQAENRTQVLSGVKSFKVDLLFVQAEILADAGGNLLEDVRKENSQSKIVVTASAFSDEAASRYAKAGAAGVILKSADPTVFVKCARKVMAEEHWFPKPDGKASAKVAESGPEKSIRPVETLTRQEKIIISYLLQGCRNREIAQHLSITEQTVKNHLRMIYDKVGVSDRLELVLYAIHQRLVLPEPRMAMAAHS